MAAVSRRSSFGGSSLLGEVVDGDTWLTPRFILSELGEFDLDPCAATQNVGWVGARRALTQHGLDDDTAWIGRVFMNPPFSNTAPWLRRHCQHGDGISLVPASVESRVWREVVWPRARAILLLHGRTRFCNPDGSSTSGRPLRSVTLIAWSEADAAVLERSTLAGVLLRSWSQR